MRKAFKISNGLGTAVLTLALVAVLGSLAKADAVDKLVSTAPTDKEIIGNVTLIKHTHVVEEHFSCSVALADGKAISKEINKHSSKLSNERRKELLNTLKIINKLIKKNQCRGK